MAGRVRYVPENRVLNLSTLNPADYQLITSLHGAIHQSDGLILECLSTGGDRAMHIWLDHKGQYWAKHFAGGAHGAHPVIPESDEHLRRKDYWARAAQNAGFEAQKEFHTGKGTVLDVAITGGLVATGIEVQRKQIPAALVKARTTKSFRAGYTVAWFHEKGAVPSFLRDVPALGCNDLPWPERMPKPREATALGLVVVKPRRCTIDAFQRCPEGSLRPCGKYHPAPEPWGGLTVDDVAEMIPAGRIVALQAPKSVQLVSPESFACYRELTGKSGKWTPGGKIRPKPIGEQSAATSCTNETHSLPEQDRREIRLELPFLSYLRNLPGRCSMCGFHVKAQGHRSDCRVTL